MSPLAAIGYPLLGVAAMNFCLAAFLLTGRRHDRLVRHAAAVAFVNTAYCAVMALAYVRAARGLPWDSFYRSAWVGWIGLAPVMQIVLFLKGDRDAERRWGIALYVVWTGILVLCWTTDLVETGASSLVPFVDRTGPLESPARALGALTLCWALLEMYRVRRASVGRRRQQIGYFLLGLAIYAVAGLSLAGVLQLVGVAFDPGLVSYFSVPWMALTVYAITRHRLFDVRFVVWRIAVATVVTALLVGFDVLVVGWLAPLVGPEAGVALASVAAGVILFMTPLVGLVRRATASVVLRRAYDHGRAMKESAAALASVAAVEDVLRRFLDLTRHTIGPASGALLLRECDVFRRRQSYGAGNGTDALPAEAPLVRWLESHAGPFVRDEQEIALAPDELAVLDRDLRAFGGEVALSIRYHGALVGILVLGRKTDQDAFLQADLDLLETLANEAAIALANARLLEELQQSLHARDDFLSVAGHELRTPLTSLHANVQLVLRTPADATRVRERAAAMERQVGRLIRLTNELLDVSRIRAQRLVLEREPTDLAAVVRDVAARFADEAARSGSAIRSDLADGVVGAWDRSRVEQVVTNLVSNAIKYGASQPICLVVERASDRARLTVRDHGIGIDPADQQRVFDRFERAVDRHQPGGFGLGLWITKQLVDAHGGTIALASTPGAGSTFVVELPLATPAPA